jgi:eukaryotic-like serine/threonine-protein kinase
MSMTVETGDLSPRQRRLEEVIAAYLAAAEKGKPPDRADLLARNPDLAADLRAFFEDHDRVRQVAGPMRALAGSVLPGPVDLPRVRYLGDYELLEEVARGGMGVVFRARQSSLNRIVALKMIRDGELATREDVHRFRAEAEAAANLDHPNIVPIYEVGEWRAGDVGPPVQYFSMKLIEGESLAAHLASLGPRPPSRDRVRASVQVVAKVARAVQHAHERGILHRDLKPSNILLDRTGEPHVVDFGLARRLAGPGQTGSLTRTGNIVGSPSYMPPEQARGQKGITTAADVYALGAILFECLTGKPPFLGQSPMDTLLRVMEQDPPRPRTLNPGVDRDLETICLKCLEKDPKRRYPSAEALADDLDRWLTDRPIRARRVGPVERLIRWARRHKSVAALVLMVCIVLVAGASVATLQATRARRAQLEAAMARRLAEEEALRARRQEAETKGARDLARQHMYAATVGLAQREFQEGFPTRAEELLDRFHSSPDRGWEWHYLKGRLHGEVLRLTGEGCVAWSPDGKLLATVAPGEGLADRNRDVLLLDATTGKVRQRLSGHTRKVECLAFSPDGKHLVTGSMDGTARVWLVESGREIFTYRGHSETRPFTVFAVAFSPDGKHVASAGNDSTLRLWEAATGKSAWPLFKGQQRRAVDDLAWRPDGKLLFSCDTLWDTTTGQPAVTLQPPPQRFHRAVFSPDGRLLALAGHDGQVTFYDTTTGKERRTWRAHREGVRGLSFSPDGTRLASAGHDRVIKVWDVIGGREQLSIRGHQASIEDIAFSPDGQRLAAADWQCVKLWNVSEKAPFPGTIPLEGLCDLVYSPDNRTLAVARVTDGERGACSAHVELWDSASRRLLRRLDETHIQIPEKPRQAPVKRVAFSADGKRLATVDALISLEPYPQGTADRIKPATVKVWDPESKQQVFSLPQAGERVVFSPDGLLIATASHTHRVVVGTDDKGNTRSAMRGGDVKLWNARSGKLVRRLEGAGPLLTFSADGRRLAVASDRLGVANSITVWDIRDDSLDHRCELPDFPESLAFSPDGHYLAAGSGWRGRVNLWDVDRGEKVSSINENREGTRSSPPVPPPVTRSPGPLVFTPGRLGASRLAYVAAGESGASTVRLWDPGTGQDVLVLPCPGRPPERLLFSPDGRTLVAVGEEGWQVWKAPALPPAQAYGRAARDLVQRLFNEVGLREEVLRRLRADRNLDDSLRQVAEALARERREDAMQLNAAAWRIVRAPGAEPRALELALRQVLAACRLEPDSPDHLNTLGAAQYRAGQYREAVASLKRAMDRKKTAGGKRAVEDLAFLAMACHRLGMAGDARKWLAQMNAAAMDGGDREVQTLMREACLLIQP